MLRRPLGTVLLAGALLLASLAGIVMVWAAWPRTSNTSPLAALFALIWTCAFAVAAVLAWRRSRRAAPAFLAAMALLMFPAFFVAPGGQLFGSMFVVVTLVAFLGYRYLRRVGPSSRSA